MISEDASEKRGRGRPRSGPLADPGFEATLRAIYPHVKTRRGLQNVAFAVHALRVLNQAGGPERFGHILGEGAPPMRLLELLGRYGWAAGEVELVSYAHALEGLSRGLQLAALREDLEIARRERRAAGGAPVSPPGRGR